MTHPHDANEDYHATLYDGGGKIAVYDSDGSTVAFVGEDEDLQDLDPKVLLVIARTLYNRWCETQRKPVIEYLVPVEDDQ